jgi:hypothetical protein
VPRPPHSGTPGAQGAARQYAAGARHGRSRPDDAAITTAATTGEITPGEAAELARVVEIYARAVEVTDFDRRLRQLEQDYMETDA